MMRQRNSSGRTRKPTVGMDSGARSSLGASANASGMGLLGGGGGHGIGGNGFRRRRLGIGRVGVGNDCCVSRGSSQGRRFSLRRNALAGRVALQAAAHGAYGRIAGWKDRLFGFGFEVGNFLLDLRLELVRGAFEFVQVFTDLAGDLGEFLRPEDDESQKKQEDRLRKTHALIILPEWEKRQSP